MGELAELADIYEQRGLPRALAGQVASAFVTWGSVAMVVTAGVGQVAHGIGIWDGMTRGDGRSASGARRRARTGAIARSRRLCRLRPTRR